MTPPPDDVPDRRGESSATAWFCAFIVGLALIAIWYLLSAPARYRTDLTIYTDMSMGCDYVSVNGTLTPRETFSHIEQLLAE